MNTESSDEPAGEEPMRGLPKRSTTIWIDLDNTPHVPFFTPIVAELRRRGYRVVLTARDAFQVCELADQHGLDYRKIGHHYGKNMFMKLVGLLYRSLQLMPVALKERPAMALSHGARSQVLIGNLLRIPTVVIADYEFAKSPPLCKPRWEIFPEVIPAERAVTKRVLKYPGIKEDVYADGFVPERGFRQRLGLTEEDLVVTVRPPATEAHYHNPEAEVLLDVVMDHILSAEDARVILLPRNGRQAAELRSTRPAWFAGDRVIVPRTALNGLDLLWHSDLVISGGGTMNREAAALRVPVYSIFRGPTGAVDHHLEQEGRLVMLRSNEEVVSRVKLTKRPRNAAGTEPPRPALPGILRNLEYILRGT